VSPARTTSGSKPTRPLEASATCPPAQTTRVRRRRGRSPFDPQRVWRALPGKSPPRLPESARIRTTEEQTRQPCLMWHVRRDEIERDAKRSSASDVLLSAL